MHSDTEAFLNAIRSDPAGDTARLVFADYLEERGDVRGEFIRLQCELARWVPDPERRAALHRRERELLDAHTADWLGPLRGLARDWQFRRGFPRLTLDAARLPEAAKWLAPAWVEEVRLVNVWPHLRAVAGSRALRHLPALSLNNQQLTDADLGPLVWAAGRARGRLPWHTLDLRNNSLTDPAGRYPDTLPGVPRLLLDGNPLTPAARRGLLELPCAAQYRPTPPGEHPEELLNSAGMRLRRIPAGTFEMGSLVTEPNHESDETPHTVTLTRPFYLGVGPVTQEQFGAVMGFNPSRFGPGAGGGPWNPVEQVTWEEAAEFCRKLSALPAERAARRAYRLPTEAEWEYACRAGTATAYAFGDHLPPAFANFLSHVGHTTPVGSYPANGFGLFDVHGNVREWCADRYQRDYYRAAPEADPPGPDAGGSRVLRGGSWDVVAARYCRSAYRVYFSPDGRLPGIGFRVACDAD